MTCVKKRVNGNDYCIGDLKHRAVFLDREITPRGDDDIDFSEVFKNNTTRWVGIETVKGIDIFDNTNIIGVASHRIVARYESDLFTKRWILFDSKYFRILQRTNTGENKEWIEFLCVERGDSSKNSNKL